MHTIPCHIYNEQGKAHESKACNEGGKKFTGKADAKLSLKEKARLHIQFMEDIFPTSDYHLSGFS